MSLQKEFYHTVNPYNRNENGDIKTEEEVYEDVKDVCDNWQPLMVHKKCKHLYIKLTKEKK